MENPSEREKQRMMTGINDKLCESKCRNIGTYIFFLYKILEPNNWVLIEK